MRDVLLFDADKELLVVALTRRCVTKNGLEAGLDDRFEAVQNPPATGLGSPEERINSFSDTRRTLKDDDLVSQYDRLFWAERKGIFLSYLGAGIHTNGPFKTECSLTRNACL